MVRWPLLRPDGLQKPRQLRHGLVLWNWLQFLERAGECVREAPQGSRLERLMHWLKVQLVHTPRQVLRKPQFVLDERLVDQQLCRSRRQLQRLPFFDLLLQRPEVSLHLIDADGQTVFDREVLRMLSENGSVHARGQVSEFTRSATTLRTRFLTMHAGKQR